MRRQNVFRFSVRLMFAVVFLMTLPCARAQSGPEQVTAIMKEEILPPQVAEFEMKEHVIRLVANPPSPSSAAEWNAEAQRLRARLLAVAFHGWPAEWVNSAPRFEDLGVFATEKGYRLRKLRYEIVPGFQSTAILYEPENMQGKIPAILNVNGHDPLGKAAEYKQKRCITFARHGILALNIEWLGMGELRQNGNSHGSGRTWIWSVRMKRASSFWPCAVASTTFTTTPTWIAPAWASPVSRAGGGKPSR